MASLSSTIFNYTNMNYEAKVLIKSIYLGIYLVSL